MAKGRRQTIKTELLTATLDDFLGAEPVINRILAAPYDPAFQSAQIDLSKRLLMLVRAIRTVRDDSGHEPIREKMLREGAKREGESWYFDDVAKQKAYKEGMRTLGSAEHTIDAPVIADSEIDGTDKDTPVLQPVPPLMAGERALIDFLLTYTDPGGEA